MTSQLESCSICNESLAVGRVFTCTKCKKKCHQECFFMCAEDEMKTCNSSKCDVCRYSESSQENSKSIKCKFCKKGEGMLKRFRDKKNKLTWTHIECIRWFMNYVRIDNEAGHISFIEHGDGVPSEVFLGDCEECNKSSSKDFFLIKCSSRDCQTTVHPSCIKASSINEASYTTPKFKYFLFKCTKCQEKIHTKKQNDVFEGVKLYGKNINTNGEANIKIVQEVIAPSNNNKDIILNSKPVVVDSGSGSNLKIKLEFRDSDAGLEKEDKNFIGKKRIQGFEGSKINTSKLQKTQINNSNKNRGVIKSSIFPGKNIPHNALNIHSRSKKLAHSHPYNKSYYNSYSQPISEADEAELFVNSVIRCDICTLEFDDFIEGNLKRCENCFVSCHVTCAKEIGEKESNNVCRKCLVDKEMTIGCFVCNRSEGSMIRCDSNWVHILCAIACKKYFYRKQDQYFALGVHNKPKTTKVCQLCRVAGLYTMTCENCGISFHPYCALNANFDFVLIDNKYGANFFAKEFTITCDKHALFSMRYKNYQCLSGVSSQNTSLKHGLYENNNCYYPLNTNNTNITNTTRSNTTKNSPNNIKAIRKLRTRKYDEITVDAINYRELKKIIYEDFKVDPSCLLKIKEWTWDVSDYYFLPIDEKCGENSEIFRNNLEDREDLHQLLDAIISEREYISNLNTTDENIEKDKNKVVCKFVSNENKEYLSVYDISSINELKYNPEYINFYSELINLQNKGEESDFNITKKTSRNLAHANNSVLGSIINKNIKIVDEEAESLTPNRGAYSSNLGSKCNSNSTTKFKFRIDEMEDYLDSSCSNSKSVLFQGDLNESQSTPDYSLLNAKSDKFLKKIKLLNYFKLRRRDRQVLDYEREAKKKIKTELGKNENISFEQLYDIDKEILTKNEMLEKVVYKNRESVHKLRERISSEKNELRVYYSSEESSEIYSTFRSVAKWGYIKRRLMKGVEDKSLQELIKSRGQSHKYGKTISRDKEEFTEYLSEFYENLRTSESECCVCFYSDFEDLTPIVFCDSCNVSIHQECYGIKEIPEGDYFCDLCLFNKRVGKGSNQTVSTHYNPQKCVLCGCAKGAMKKLSKNGDYWAHVTCIFLSSSLQFKNYDTMEDVVGFSSKMVREEKYKKCFYCKLSTGDLFSCSYCANGNFFFHFFCAYLNGLKIEIKEEANSLSNHNLPHSKYLRKLTPIIDCGIHFTSSRNISEQKDLRIMTYHKAMAEEEEISSKVQKSSEQLGRDSHNKTCELCREMIEKNTRHNYLKTSVNCCVINCENQFHQTCAEEENLHKEKTQHNEFKYYCKLHSFLYRECQTNTQVIVAYIQDTILKNSYSGKISANYEGEKLFFNLLNKHQDYIDEIIKLLQIDAN